MTGNISKSVLFQTLRAYKKCDSLNKYLFFNYIIYEHTLIDRVTHTVKFGKNVIVDYGVI